MYLFTKHKEFIDLNNFYCYKNKATQGNTVATTQTGFIGLSSSRLQTKGGDQFFYSIYQLASCIFFPSMNNNLGHSIKFLLVAQLGWQKTTENINIMRACKTASSIKKNPIWILSRSIWGKWHQVQTNYRFCNEFFSCFYLNLSVHKADCCTQLGWEAWWRKKLSKQGLDKGVDCKTLRSQPMEKAEHLMSC